MKIQVTQQDIDKGDPCLPWCCPVALAVRRTLPPEAQVSVSSDYIRINGVVLSLPAHVVEFIDMVDDYQDPEPIEFELNIAT